MKTINQHRSISSDVCMLIQSENYVTYVVKWNPVNATLITAINSKRRYMLNNLFLNCRAWTKKRFAFECIECNSYWLSHCVKKRNKRLFQSEFTMGAHGSKEKLTRSTSERYVQSKLIEHERERFGRFGKRARGNCFSLIIFVCWLLCFFLSISRFCFVFKRIQRRKCLFDWNTV